MQELRSWKIEILCISQEEIVVDSKSFFKENPQRIDLAIKSV